MPEAALPRLDPARRERLAALGVELLALREQLALGVPDAAPAAAGPRLGVTGIPWPSPDSLLRGVLRALCVEPAAVAAGRVPGVPGVHFGASPPDGDDTLALPTLAELRDPSAKRAAWRQLRPLKRRLRSGGPR